MDQNKKDKKQLEEEKKLQREASGYYRKGLERLRKKNYFEALEFFQNTLKLKPDEGKAHLNLARIYLKLKEPASAAVCYEDLLKINPSDREALDYLIGYYDKKNRFRELARVLEMKADAEKKTKKQHRLMSRSAEAYFKGEDYENAGRMYHRLLRIDVYNPDIFEKLKTIYHKTEDHHRWKICEELLIINNRITSPKTTSDIGLIKRDSPLTEEVFTGLVHPGEETFRKFFSWMNPIFKLMEQPTPPEVLRLSENAQDEEVYPLFRECCHYLNMEPPPLRHYNGKTLFRFLADPMEEGEPYSLIYHDKFIKTLAPPEKAFAFLNQLILIKSNFIPLLNLSLSDVARTVLEAGSLVFGALSFAKSLPLDKAAKFLDKSGKSSKAASKAAKFISGFGNKLKSFKFLGKSADEMQAVVRTSIDMLPEKIKNEKEFDRRTIMNRKFLESSLLGLFFTADRVAYYYTGDLITATKTILKMLESQATLERVEKFGLQPYISSTRNNILKSRLAELYLFALDAGTKKEGSETSNPSDNDS